MHEKSKSLRWSILQSVLSGLIMPIHALEEAAGIYMWIEGVHYVPNDSFRFGPYILKQLLSSVDL